MNVLTYSTLWPNPVQPLHGIFIRERTKALGKLCSVRIVAPVPWFPPFKCFGQRYFKYTLIPHFEKQEMLEVSHPRYITFPKVLKWSDGLLMYASLRHKIQSLRSDFAFDVIDAHWAFPDGYAASCIARKMGIPYILTVRGSDLSVFARDRVRRMFIRRALINAQKVVCVARSLQKLVIALGVRPEKTVVIENGIDPDKFHFIDQDEARQHLGFPVNARILLSVGHLCELKGFHLLVEAAHRLKSANARSQNNPQLKLIIIGGDAAWDPYQGVLERQIEEHKLQNIVTLAGPKAPEELRYWYAAADVFCLASSREGCPNVVLESLGCGTPVVGTAVGSIPDILSSPNLGVLVERNVDSIQQGVSGALRNSWNRQRIAEHAHNRYSWERTAAKVYSALQEAVKSQ